MRDPRLYPLTFIPTLRDYVWGGRRLEKLYGRALPPGVVAESWEISGHAAAPTLAAAGYWAGQALPTILAALGEQLVGSRAVWALARDRFPLLVKLIDAREDLSVQVHPGDEYALTHENGELGKTEAWYLLAVEPGARLILGLRPNVTRAAFRQALRSGRINELLNYVPVSAGQVVSVPTGTVHALLAGALVTEIQQNSDLTYRVYDWGRVGADGNPRPLHVEKALDVINFSAPSPGIAAPTVLEDTGVLRRLELVHNRYFVLERLDLALGTTYRGVCDGRTLEIFGCMSGEVSVYWDGEPVSLPAIRYALLPAALGPFTLSASTPSTCLRVYLPPQAS